MKIYFPPKFQPLFRPARYKIFWGGRGGMKSWNFADALLIIGASQQKRILCGREFQSSIADSVHKLLSEQIDRLKIPGYKIQRNTIVHRGTGSEFLFKGFHRNIQEIKSTEGVDILWVEEAANTAKESWRVLGPTIRKPGSEIWVSYNPDLEEDATHQLMLRLQAHGHPQGAYCVKVGYEDNPALPKTLDDERRFMLETDPEAYDWVWNGNCRQISDAVIFKRRVSVRTFDPPPDGTRLFYGGDFGFADDPSTLIRCWVKDNILYIDHEAYGHHIELDEMPAFYRSVPGADKWPIKGDSSRPETISYLRRQGFNISAADKWDGSVEDGIAHLKGFKEIVVHERCKHTAQEFRLYKFKVDKNSGDILPVIVDAHNHCIDALRYSLDGYIQRRGSAGVWRKLAGK